MMVRIIFSRAQLGALESRDAVNPVFELLSFRWLPGCRRKRIGPYVNLSTSCSPEDDGLLRQPAQPRNQAEAVLPQPQDLLQRRLQVPKCSGGIRLWGNFHSYLEVVENCYFYIGPV